MNYDELKAGQELDALIAVKVMGLPAETGHFMIHAPIYLPYSTNISSAWEVVEKIKTPNIRIEIQMPFGDNRWICWISNLKKGTIGGAGADCAATAICRAVLKAKETP